MHNDELAGEYRGRIYTIEGTMGIVTFTIGAANRALDYLLGEHDLLDWAFITAYNPGSFTLPPGENERNNADLRERISALGYLLLPGFSSGASMRSDEHGYFIGGIDRGMARELGRFYRQRVVVVGTAGGQPQLLRC